MNDTLTYNLTMQKDTLQRSVSVKSEDRLGDSLEYKFYYEINKENGERILRDSSRKLTLILAPVVVEKWPFLKDRNWILPF